MILKLSKTEKSILIMSNFYLLSEFLILKVLYFVRPS